MTAKEYLQSLIDGMTVSDLPIQLSELKLLKQFMEYEEK